MRALVLLALLAAPLAACGDKEGDSAISFSGNGTDGNFAINVPGFSGNVKLPKLKLDASNVEFNGVHLYPGSTVSSFNLDASGDGDKGNGKVRIGFDSPADPATVRDWLAERLGKANFTLRAQGNSLIGTDDEKKPFRIDFEPAGAGKSKGVVTAGS
ncbi:MAG: hypothetical protein K2W81_08205 [Sphingomonas sp.]|uniref:hypothetical protein n=1 Tax=Sphingomonas sp. TaxID=28214 RepID=UPI0025DA2345|nr:hypothetical protein [Sphingomonas sp.]MBY0283932.1 hypothetical protein [Sphingomonas sp.]